MTYLQLKTAVLLQLGEENNVTFTDGVPSITLTTAVVGYLKQIPDLLREAANILQTAGKYVVKEYTQTLTEPGEIDTADISDYYALHEVWLDGNLYSQAIGKGVRYLYFPDAGAATIFYYAYPTQIGYDIADTDTLDFDPEVYSLIVLYICGKLRMFLDEDYAMQVLNEFEQRRSELAAKGARRAHVTKGCVEW